LISYHYLSPEMKKENYSKFQYQTNLWNFVPNPVYF
jgi:hypothetical protein